MVVVCVGSCRACFSGYLMPLEGQLDFWPSDIFSKLVIISWDQVEILTNLGLQ